MGSELYIKSIIVHRILGNFIVMLETLTRQSIPTLLAVFINLLDACAFGTFFFPPQLGQTSGLAVEIFLLSTMAAQVALLVNSSFGSCLGTAMVENIPFIHTISLSVMSSLQITSRDEVRITGISIFSVWAWCLLHSRYLQPYWFQLAFQRFWMEFSSIYSDICNLVTYCTSSLATLSMEWPVVSEYSYSELLLKYAQD